MEKYCEYCKLEREYSTLNEGGAKTFICSVCNSVVGRTKKKGRKKKEEMVKLEVKELIPQDKEIVISCLSCKRASSEVLKMLVSGDGNAMCDTCIKFFAKHFIEEMKIIPLHVEDYVKIIDLCAAKRIKYDEEKKILWIGESLDEGDTVLS